MLELIIISIIVLWSVYIVFKKVFPTAYTRTLVALSKFCQKQGWTGLANWLKPPMAMGCGGSCGCKASEPPSSPVKWK